MATFRWGGVSLFALGLGAALVAGERPIRVGLYEAHGAAPACVQDAREALRLDPAITVTPLTPADIQARGLKGLDAVVFPGGGGSRQVLDLGAGGAEAVRAFVRAGGGAVGLCAGAYMLSDTPGYACLHLAPAAAIDRDHDERGHGMVLFTPAGPGLAFFPELKEVKAPTMCYYEGPILVPAEGAEVLATLVSDVALENDAPKGMTPGRPLFLRAPAGKGRVFLSVGHPESTPGMRWMVARMVRWTVGRAPAPPPPGSVRPGLTGEILFDKVLRAEEEALFQTLLYGTAPERAAAVARLAAVRSWAGPRWIRGALRDADPAVRSAAAGALGELESTWTLPDLEAALAAEKDAQAAAALRSTRDQFKSLTGR